MTDVIKQGGTRRGCGQLAIGNRHHKAEIGIEGQAQFLAAGGQQLRLIPCLNDSAAFIRALADLVERNMQGWPLDPAQQDRQRAEAHRSAERAIAMGAPR